MACQNPRHDFVEYERVHMILDEKKPIKTMVFQKFFVTLPTKKGRR
jgi:hypothetical protein